MNNLTATGQLYGQTVTLKKVSKAAARTAFCNGIPVYLQGSNMRPFGVWQSVCPIQLDTDQLRSDIGHNNWCIQFYTNSVKELTAKNEPWSKEFTADQAKKAEDHKAKVINEASQFEERVWNYASYNCDSERGRYVHFYIAL